MLYRIILVLLVGWVAACSGRKEPEGVRAASEPSRAVSVRVTASQARTVERVILVTGALYPDETVTISSEVAGRVLSVKADFGQSVRKGDVLVELDSREYQLQLERARAALAQALARIGADSPEAAEQTRTTPAIRQATAQMEDAKSKFDNAARLVASGDISRERYVELEKALRARQATLDAARDELRTQQAQIQALRAEVALAEKRLADSTVRAPVAGAVSQRHVSPGQYTKENTPLLTLVKADPLRLRLDVPENAAASVRIGETLAFTTDAVAGRTFRAVVRELNPSLDPRSRSLQAEARLVGSETNLRPGMFVQVRLVTERNAQVVAVPRSAVYTVAGLTKVFVVRDGKAVEHRFVPGVEEQGWVEVPGAAFKAGEMVAISNLAQLVNGTPVAVESR